MTQRDDRRYSRNAFRAGVVERVLSTFWFLPTVMLVAAAILAVVAAWVDRSGFGPAALGSWIDGSPGAVRELLAGLATSMLTIATVTFSILMVAMSFASGQLGPRVLRNFIRDRFHQVMLGWFLAVHVFAMAARTSIRAREDGGTYPLTLLIALVLGAASVLLLIHFLHHVAVGIQADTVVADVRRDLVRAVDRLLPDEREREEEEEPPAIELDAALDREDGDDAAVVQSEARGYVQAIDYLRLVSLGARHGCTLVCPFRPGDFVREDSAIVFTADGSSAEDLAEDARAAFLIGAKATDAQDLAYSIRQLAEMALRALSPSLNDPYTAMTCIDHLGDAMSTLATRRLLGQRVEDDDGDVRLVRAIPRYDDLLSVAFDDIRRASAGHVAVTIRLLKVLGRVRASARLESRRNAVEELAVAVVGAAEDEALPPRDRARIRAAAAESGVEESGDAANRDRSDGHA